MDSLPVWPTIFERLRINTHWYNKSYSGYYFGVHLQTLGAMEEAKTPWGLKYIAVFQNYKEKDHMDTFWDLDDLMEKREAFLFMAKRNPAQIEVILQEAEANHARFVAHTQTLNGLDIVGQTDKDLRQTFFELQQELISVARWSYSVDAFLHDGEEDWLEATIKQYLGERATLEVMATLTLPTFSSFPSCKNASTLKTTELPKSIPAAAQKTSVASPYPFVLQYLIHSGSVYAPQTARDSPQPPARSPQSELDSVLP
jgi:hypothetical protein